MKLCALAILLSSVVSSCSAETSDTNEVRTLLAGLTNLPAWMGASSSTVTSNKLERLKHLAIPILLEKVSSLDQANDAEVRKIGLACAVLGTNARPVLQEVVKDTASKDPDKRSVSLLILQLAGPIALEPLIEFETSGVHLAEPGIIKKYILEYTAEFPSQHMTELVRAYFRTGKSQSIQKYITLTLRDAIGCERSEELIPVLKVIFAEQDEFLVLESLAYIHRCDSLVPKLKDDLGRLLASSNSRIQLEAKKVVQPPEKTP